MRNLLRFGAAFLWVAVVAAGVAAGDPPPWAGNSKHDGDARPGEWAAGEQTRPILLGRLGADWRGERYLDVRGHDQTYVVDISRVDMRGTRHGRLRRDDRVLVWGRLSGRHAISADRIRVLRDDDAVPCAVCGKTGCLRHADRDNYDPRYDPADDPDFSPDNRVNRYLEGRVTRASDRWSRRDLSVASLGSEWRVDVPKDARVTRGDEPISVHEIRVGEYVRIRGERVDDRAFRADRVEVDRSTDASPWPGPRPNDDGAYRGSVRSIDSREGTFALRLNFFEDYVVRVGVDTRILRDGREVRLRDLREDDRVRVRGRLNTRARTIDASEVEIL